jgi:SAM-dependent methyltransferase
MHADIIDLQKFYRTEAGYGVRRIISAYMQNIWPDNRNQILLALGYTPPFLDSIQAKQLFVMMPAAQGVAHWPESDGNCTCLVDMEHLPLPDQSIDRIIMMHTLEGAASPQDTLNEAWRVLQSNGRLLLVVTNRRGLWAHSDRTPFGTGRPYSPFQIKDMLRNHGFYVERTVHALYTPRQLFSWPLAITNMIEKYGARFFPGFGGLIILEASKQFYDPTPVRVKKYSPWWVLPMPMPAPAMTYGHTDK